MLNGRPLDIGRDRRGQTMVEFALVVALFLAILFGIIEFGRLWFYSNHLNNSVRAAARYGAVLGSGFPNGPKGTVEGYLTRELEQNNMTDIEDIRIEVTDANGNTVASPSRGCTITVTVEYNFTVLSASVIPYFSGEYVLERSASMRFE